MARNYSPKKQTHFEDEEDSGAEYERGRERRRNKDRQGSNSRASANRHKARKMMASGEYNLNNRY